MLGSLSWLDLWDLELRQAFSLRLLDGLGHITVQGSCINCCHVHIRMAMDKATTCVCVLNYLNTSHSQMSECWFFYSKYLCTSIFIISNFFLKIHSCCIWPAAIKIIIPSKNPSQTYLIVVGVMKYGEVLNLPHRHIKVEEFQSLGAKTTMSLRCLQNSQSR